MVRCIPIALLGIVLVALPLSSTHALAQASAEAAQAPKTLIETFAAPAATLSAAMVGAFLSLALVTYSRRVEKRFMQRRSLEMLQQELKENETRARNGDWIVTLHNFDPPLGVVIPFRDDAFLLARDALPSLPQKIQEAVLKAHGCGIHFNTVARVSKASEETVDHWPNALAKSMVESMLKNLVREATEKYSAAATELSKYLKITPKEKS